MQIHLNYTKLVLLVLHKISIASIVIKVFYFSTSYTDELEEKKGKREKGRSGVGIQIISKPFVILKEMYEFFLGLK